MAGKALFVILFGVCLCNPSVQSSQPFYSLQPAVEALSEREAQLALRNEIENGNIDDFVDSDDFDLVNDYDNLERERFQVPNRAWGNADRYVGRAVGDYDEFYPADFRKRSMYRKRDGSVFRERSRAPNMQYQQQQALAEKFLKAIEEERQREEEEEYRKQLHNLWNRYQREEDNMEQELFENELDPEYGVNNDDRKKKRQNVGEVEVAPSYWNDKRSMPLLPWLPASRKKRFPVTKRSPKVNNELIIATPEANEKVSKDLQGIFGGENGKHGDGESSAKKKRSSDKTHALSTENSKKEEKSQMVNVHVQEAHKKRKRDVSDPDDDDEAENDNDNEEGESDNDEGGDEDSEEEERRKKKKREVSKSLETVKEVDKKKDDSFKWSNIFGLDRKKKSTGLVFHPLEVDERRRKRCNEENCSEEDDSEEDDEDDYRRKKKQSREEKLDIMDRKLKNIENLIIEDTTKYYDNHDGSISPSEARALRNRVAERLATAYSLEKMRKAIARLKESMELEKNLERNLLIGVQSIDKDDDDKKKAKRVAIKKEKAEFDNNDHDIESPEKKVVTEPKKNDLDENDKKKKRKRSQKKSDLNNLINDEAPMSEGYMGGGRMMSECPMLDNIEKKCRGIDIMSGDSHQNLLDACGEHQLCYLCGDSQLQCDYEYLNNAEGICGHDLRCKIAARQALSVLKNFGGNRISPRECIRNPCLNMAIRSVGY